MTTYPAPSPEFIKARWHGGSQKPRSIVVHGTVTPCRTGMARSVAHDFATTSVKKSAQYVVDPGTVIQCVGDHTVSYNCGYNDGTLAVELCDPVSGPATRWGDKNHRAMLARAEHLIAELCLAYGIDPMHVTVASLKAHGPHGIYDHNQSRLAFGHTTHTDVGPGFPWAAFISGIKREIGKMTANDDPNYVEKYRAAVLKADRDYGAKIMKSRTGAQNMRKAVKAALAKGPTK